MSIDPNNPVVKLCAQGVQAEMQGRVTEAADLYMQAWDSRTNENESCIAAHYVARVQSDVAQALHWNTTALFHAGQVTDDLIAAFYPSLYLNVGKSYEDMGEYEDAKKYYLLGAEKVSLLPDDKLGNMTKDAIKRGLDRIAALQV